MTLEIEKQNPAIKTDKDHDNQAIKAPAQALLDFANSLPEPAPSEEPTDYARQVDDILYRNRQFK